MDITHGAPDILHCSKKLQKSGINPTILSGENANIKRLVRVLPPEKEDGNVEYKRQVLDPSASRLRQLATQMSYRLDEGKGIAKYQIGVEDDGCHSLLDCSKMRQSVKILTLIARALNSLVVTENYVQNEIGGYDSTTAIVKEDEKKDQVHESFGNEDYKEEMIAIGIPTRCELTVQRVETHLLDLSPMSLASISEAIAFEPDDTDEADMSVLKVGSPGVNSMSISSEGEDQSDGTTSTNEAIPLRPASTSAKGSSISETLSARNIRIAVVGNVDAGKSTLIGTLTTSCLDDGRGRSRTSIMKHRHEIETGRTSTATTHLLGFKSDGQVIKGKDSLRSHRIKSEDEIARESHRIITLMDLAGHEKYLKTTIHGVSSGFADYSLILVNSRHPPTHMTQQHLNLCCSFGIPVIVVLTKVDGCPEHALNNCKKEISKLLRAKEINRKPFGISNEDNIATCIGKLHILAPIIESSCVTGAGMDLIRKLLFALPKRRHHENKAKRPFEFLVEDIFNVPGVGGVVSGFVNAGELTVGSGCQVYVGPCDDGTFMKTIAKSAHIARINTSHVTSGQSACLAFSLNKDMRKKLRRGMVVLTDNPTSTKEFDAEICVLKGEGTTIRRSYQAYVHILNVRQSAYAKHIELVKNELMPTHSSLDGGDDEGGIVLRPGCRAKVRFEFAKRPEYIRPGMRMLFRDGRVRGVGIITAIPVPVV